MNEIVEFAEGYNRFMHIYCTYCSKDKHPADKPVPAFKIYDSYRIQQLYLRGKKDGCPLFMLSGKYGLISAEQPIHYYNHLLINEEIQDFLPRVAAQLIDHAVSEVSFFHVNVSSDPNIKPYLKLIHLVCDEAKIKLNLNEIDLPEHL